jgi:hypothetical protein
VTGQEHELPVVFAHADALAAGYSRGEVRGRAASRWPRLRRGQFSRAELEGEARWRGEVLAIVRTHQRPLVLSHAHAARAYGWTSPLRGWGPPSFTSPVPPARRRRGVWISVATLAEAEIELHGPVAVTSRVRTVVDCARRLPPHEALAIADAALREGRVDKAGLRQALALCGSSRGSRRAAVVIELADGRRETALESWSAWAFECTGLPRPRWQATVLDHEGVLIGRADAWWEQGVVGEADGRAKYRLKSLERRGVLDAEGLAQALDEERRRERELVRSGARIVRWEPRDVLDAGRSRALAAHLRRTLAAASREPAFTGRILLL